MHPACHSRIFPVLAVMISIIFNPLAAQDNSLFQLINDHPEAQVILVFDIDSLEGSKMLENDHPALFSLATETQNLATFSCKLSARGSYRKRNCDYPPLKLNFVKGDLKDLDMDKYDEYKLVSECLQDDDAYIYLLKEYLIYQMYSTLTDYSFKTTHFDLLYRDVDSDYVMKPKGFLIESDKETKDRLDGKWCDCEDEDYSAYDPYQYELFCLFQYMIGNRDVVIGSGHNVHSLRRKEDSVLIPVPYDFDFSLFVNAPYAFPEEEDRIVPVFLGRAENKAVLESVFQLYLDKKEELLGIIDGFEPLPRRVRRECKSYLEAFYDKLEEQEYQMSYVH